MHVKKKEQECLIIDIAVTGDKRVQSKEDEKCEKYDDLGRVLRRLWGVRCQSILVIMSALEVIPLRPSAYLAMLKINLSVGTIKESAILGTAKILQKF